MTVGLKVCGVGHVRPYFLYDQTEVYMQHRVVGTFTRQRLPVCCTSACLFCDCMHKERFCNVVKQAETDVLFQCLISHSMAADECKVVRTHLKTSVSTGL